ncbi:hypothetical protein CDL15_Pgr020903 [Punica granatum]|nr:hypothetical protein CDL15_Pgr020903 [Punica granatum]PKI78089.1 hypothetical protein CRG98_001539 [Punica granatum]
MKHELSKLQKHINSQGVLVQDLMTGVALGRHRKRRTSDTDINKSLELIQSSIASRTEMSNSSSSSKKSESVSSPDRYSIEACMKVLYEMENITAHECVAAAMTFLQADWRTVFIMMPDDARRAWVAKEAQK